MDGNYIKISRSILEWEWYSDINTCRLFIHMLLKANWKNGKFKGMDVPRGSFVSSTVNLSEETGLTQREVRTAISHLKTTGEVTSKSTSKFTVFSIKNYDLYQTNDKQNDIQATNERHSNDIQTTTIEERKNIRREEININNNSFCPELEKSTPASKAVIAFALNDGTMYDVTENDVERFKQLYPGIDVMQELRNIVGWCDGNPKNRKTRSGAKRFLNGWMSRAQNRAPVQKQEGQAPKLHTKFHNFKERDYDFKELERQLINQ